ncbi:MAG: PfkB family carbohydrate kinase [Phenylobacterium sp.]
MRALVISSFVAGEAIGGGAQVLALERLGFAAALVPTVLLGRSPAKGGRGLATDPQHLAAMLQDVEAEGFLAADLVVTGHFSHPDQVEAAAAALRRRVRGLVVVDPILGDAPRGLYVRPDVAEAVEALLLPLADWITPNLWELSHLTGLQAADAEAVRHAAAQLEPPALVTSVPAGGGEIGLMLCDGAAGVLLAHPRLPAAPNGTGDLVAAVFGAGLARGDAPLEAALTAVGAVLARLGRPEAPIRTERFGERSPGQARR